MDARTLFLTTIPACLLVAAVSPAANAQRALGVDVSGYQGPSINWASVKNAGISFAWTKAAEATPSDGYIDPATDFFINQTNARAAGVLVGAYYFAHPSIDTPATAANYYWSVAGPYIQADGKSLMPMLDVELFTGHNGASSYADWVNQWCDNIVAKAAATGVSVRPVIYISACNAGYLDASVGNWIPWIADYNKQNPQSGTPWSTCVSDDVWGSGVWSLWQYSSTGTVHGISGNVDVDVFNGSESQMAALLVPTSATAPTTPTVQTQPATTVSSNWATLNMSVNPNGASTTVYFAYGTSTNYSSTTFPVNSGAGTTTVTASTAVTGLTPGTTFHFQAIASNPSGISYGSDVSFTTVAVPVPLNATLQTNNSLVLSWPADAAGFQLEFATNAGPGAIWSPVTNLPSVQDGSNVVTNSIDADEMFFRLRHP
jgi:GH25 family lysozyme M1 (1,4-beta-N-acetylmuramidase)